MRAAELYVSAGAEARLTYISVEVGGTEGSKIVAPRNAAIQSSLSRGSTPPNPVRDCVCMQLKVVLLFVSSIDVPEKPATVEMHCWAP